MPSPLSGPAPAPPSKSPIVVPTAAPSGAPLPLPPQSPGAGPSTPSTPAFTLSRNGTPTSPTFGSRVGPNGPAAPPTGPPLGGRLVDGTRSMFLPTSSIPSPGLPRSTTPATNPSSSVPSSASASTSTLPQTPVTPYHEKDPLGPLSPGAQARRNMTLSASFSPLGPSVNSYANGADVDPIGGLSPLHMSQSVRLPPTPTRKRLDAREAASKLANMF